MKVLLYGGTFDPPHNGHMNNLRAALDLVRPDRAIVMPAGTPPHKAASATPGEVRLAMCDCFKALSPLVEVSDWEIRRGGRSYTYNTLEMLQQQCPGAELFLSIGSDMLLSFPRWNRWRDILQMATLVVESRRPGDALALHTAAQQLGCNKVALGHHLDDAIETFYMNLWREGRIGCFSPVTYLSRRDLTMIRPLLLATESEVSAAVRRAVGSCCMRRQRIFA